MRDHYVQLPFSSSLLECQKGEKAVSSSSMRDKRNSSPIHSDRVSSSTMTELITQTRSISNWISFQGVDNDCILLDKVRINRFLFHPIQWSISVDAYWVTETLQISFFRLFCQVTSSHHQKRRRQGGGWCWTCSCRHRSSSPRPVLFRLIKLIFSLPPTASGQSLSLYLDPRLNDRSPTTGTPFPFVSSPLFFSCCSIFFLPFFLSFFLLTIVLAEREKSLPIFLLLFFDDEW